jgi:hypothetical protein
VRACVRARNVARGEPDRYAVVLLGPSRDGDGSAAGAGLTGVLNTVIPAASTHSCLNVRACVRACVRWFIYTGTCARAH